MTRKEYAKIIKERIKDLERAIYKGEFGTPEDNLSADYYYAKGYVEALKVMIDLLEDKFHGKIY